MKTKQPRLVDFFAPGQDSETPTESNSPMLAQDAIVYGEPLPLARGKIIRLKRSTLAQDQAVTYGEPLPIALK